MFHPKRQYLIIMKLKKLCVFFISLGIFLLIYRCNKNSHTSSDLYINLDSRNEVSIFDIFSKIEIIPLETNDTCLIGDIDKLILHDSLFYLLDTKQNSVSIFNQEGKFIQNIKRIGRGPGEYLYVYDFTINEYDHTIELLDPFGKLIIFNLDGTHKESIRLPHPPAAYHKFFLLNQDSILFFTNSNDINENLLYAYSRSSNKIIKEFYKDSHTDVMNRLPIFSWNNIVYLTLPMENTIFQIENLQTTPAYIWDFGKYNYKYQIKDVPKDHKEKAKFYEAIGASYPMSYMHIRNLQNEQYLYCSLSHFFEYKHIFYDKKTKTSCVFMKTTENISLVPPYFMNNEMMIGVEYPNSETYKQLLEAKIIKPNDQNPISSVVEDSNPVLVKYTFK